MSVSLLAHHVPRCCYIWWSWGGEPGRTIGRWLQTHSMGTDGRPRLQEGLPWVSQCGWSPALCLLSLQCRKYPLVRLSAECKMGEGYIYRASVESHRSGQVSTLSADRLDSPLGGFRLDAWQTPWNWQSAIGFASLYESSTSLRHMTLRQMTSRQLFQKVESLCARCVFKTNVLRKLKPYVQCGCLSEVSVREVRSSRMNYRESRCAVMTAGFKTKDIFNESQSSNTMCVFQKWL